MALEYLEHLLFDFDFVHRAQLLAKEALFVPIGWDTTEKIQVDFRNQQASSDAQQAFEEVILKPSSVLEQEIALPIVVPEDDQAFLERHRNAMEKQEIVKKKKEERDGTQPTLQSPAPAPAAFGSPAATPEAKEAFRASYFEQLKTSSRPPSTMTTPVSSPAPKSGSSSINRDEMKSFFNNLLKKDKS